VRSLVLLLVGLVVGALCTLIAVNALNRETPYDRAVMAMMGQQMKAIGASVKASRCAQSDIAPRLQALRLLANDIEPAFAGEQDDPQFGRYAADLRASADAALAAPPASCPAASATLSSLKKSCDSCHRDFRS
jgi:cytochrome c556